MSNLIDNNDFNDIIEEFKIKFGVGLIAQKAAQALRELCFASQIIDKSLQYFKHYVSGLGEVYNLIRDFFFNDKLKYLLKKLEYFLHKKLNIFIRIFKRKTTKTTLHPMRLKGWKGRR